MVDSDNSHSPVLHVVVVGFHHKKGCQVGNHWPGLGHWLSLTTMSVGYAYARPMAKAAYGYVEDKQA